jgi:hypothetical protein
MDSPAPAPDPGPWREPSSLLPLRWGDAPLRLWTGGWWITGGGLAIAGSNTFSLWVLGLGTLFSVLGWCALPSAGWRRTVAVGPGVFAMWLLLTGPRFVIVLVIPYLCWLLVRHRPAITSLTAIPVAVMAVLVGNVYGGDYSRMPEALLVVGATMVVSAWAAALIARRTGRRRR